MEHLFAEKPRDGRAAEMLPSADVADPALLHCNKEFASGHIGAWVTLKRAGLTPKRR